MGKRNKALRRGMAALGALALGMMGVEAQAACQVGLVAKLPITLRQQRASLPVSINGKPTEFWIDTGAFFNFMPRAKAAELGLGLSPLPIGFYMSGIGGSVSAQLATVKDVDLAGQLLHRVDFVVGGSDAGNGWLGANLFYPFDSEFDMAHGAVNLLRVKGCGDKSLAYWAGQRFVGEAKLQPGSNERDMHIYASVTVNGVPFKALLDTGAPISSLSRRAAQRAGIDMNGPGVEEAGMSAGIGTKFRKIWITKLSSFEIGGETIQNNPIDVLDEDLEPEDMILGMDFFLSHHLLVSRSQRTIYFTYNGGAVFTPRGAGHSAQVLEQNMGGATREEAPTDASGFARRGAARLARQDYAGAIADYSEAIRLDPVQGDYLEQRARAYAGNGRRDLAAKDQQAAMKLLPDDPKLLLMQARQALGRNPERALVLAERAASLTPKGSLDNRALVPLFERLHQPERALALVEDMIALHKEDSALGGLLNMRCYERGLANVDLDPALKDCEKAIRRDGAKPDYLDSRALIHLRQKNYAAALADYDKVMAARPVAFVQYLRGLARLGAGQKAEGEADIAAAQKADPHAVEWLIAYGLAAP